MSATWSVSFNLTLDKTLDDGTRAIAIIISWRDDNKKSHARKKRTGLSCNQKEWDKINKRIQDQVWGSQKKNKELQAIIEKARSIYREHFERIEWDYKKWSMFYENKCKPQTFTSFAKKTISQKEQIGNVGNADRYRDSLKAIQKFLGKKDILFSDIRKRTLHEFEEYQLSNGTKGITNFSNLKSIFSRAVEQQVIPLDQMPFKCGYQPLGYSFAHLKSLKMPQKSDWIKRLSLETINVLKSYQPISLADERDMDLFWFSYYTMGTDLIDIGLMEYKHIEDNLWYYQRKKTNEGGVGKPLTSKAKKLIEKHYSSENKYIFNWLFGVRNYDADERTIKNRKDTILANLRRRYSQVSKRLELDGRFSWRSARYSSSTNAVSMGGDIKIVQTLMDHSSITTTERYVRYGDHNRMIETLELL